MKIQQDSEYWRAYLRHLRKHADAGQLTSDEIAARIAELQESGKRVAAALERLWAALGQTDPTVPRRMRALREQTDAELQRLAGGEG